MDALLLLLSCFALGLLVARLGHPPGLVQGLNWWVLNVALPSLVLALIPRVRPDPQLWFPGAAMWLVFLGAWAVAAFAGRRLGWPRGRIGAVVLTAGFGNTAFVGFPLIEALRGVDALALAVIADQLGSAVALATGGITVAAWYAGRRAEPRAIVRRIVLFPAFPALLIGFGAGLLGGWPQALEGVFTRLGATLTPLALFSVGLQFRLQLDRARLGAAAFALSWKLALAPLCVYLLGTVAGIDQQILAVGVLQAAMAPMVSSVILADQYGLEPQMVNMTLGVGIVASLLTVPLLHLLL